MNLESLNEPFLLFKISVWQINMRVNARLSCLYGSIPNINTFTSRQASVLMDFTVYNKKDMFGFQDYLV